MTAQLIVLVSLIPRQSKESAKDIPRTFPHDGVAAQAITILTKGNGGLRLLYDDIKKFAKRILDARKPPDPPDSSDTTESPKTPETPDPEGDSKDGSNPEEFTKFFRSLDQQKVRKAAEAALIGTGVAVSATEATGYGAVFVSALETVGPLILLLF